MRTAITVMLSIFLFTGSASAAMYKWKDADGSIQYGQYPPSGVEATRIKSDRTPKTAPATRKPLQEQVREMEARQERQQEEKSAAELEKKNAAIRKQNCKNAHSNIAELGYGGNRLAAMADGTYKRLTEEEKQKMIKKNEEAIKKYCD
ncbi:MAG TPA: DUF4124 domain-containing protein [Gammaproteobacteria bacterium]|nr:DUF4124 domain-containing protein [Gammaproteobacteria bacterium]